MLEFQKHVFVLYYYFRRFFSLNAAFVLYPSTYCYESGFMRLTMGATINEFIRYAFTFLVP